MANSDRRDAANAGDLEPVESLRRIKRVSRIKHAILHGYLPVWARILGSANQRLCYFDCYAGEGEFEFEGRRVDGSPLVAVRSGNRYVAARPGRLMTIVLIEKNADKASALERCLAPFQPYQSGLQVYVLAADSEALVEHMLARVDKLAPSFFMIDPYGHPLSVPLVNGILGQPGTEALINVMWYQINRDLGNPAVCQRVDGLFGDKSWRSQPFMSETGKVRERHFVEFFCAQLHGRYVLPFRIGFDPEDKIPGHRTKYYLLHVSNHPKAVLLMKQVMWPLGDEDGTFDFSGEAQGILISKTPKEEELEQILLREFAGETIAFDDIREKTWSLPFIEKHYRSVLKGLEGRGKATVKRITSKKTGLSGQDLICFP
ncbi:MAG: three-Cys-motif partner protein TcmP [Terriglobia bacterium]